MFEPTLRFPSGRHNKDINIIIHQFIIQGNFITLIPDQYFTAKTNQYDYNTTLIY
jgi:hypothetical protein